jgi:hypothetical protein
MMDAAEIMARASFEFAKREWDAVPRVDRARRVEEMKFVLEHLICFDEIKKVKASCPLESI